MPAEKELSKMEKAEHKEFIIVSYYTKGTPYQAEAERLKATMEIFDDVPFRIMEVGNRGSWQQNTHYKAKFIRQMMDTLDVYKYIIWVDADAMIHRRPELFWKLKGDVVVHFRNWKHGRNELLTGTIAFRNCEKCKELVDEWIEVNRQNKGTWEQRNLQRVINRNRFMLDVQELPVSYCCIFDDQNRHKINPVIEHFQASRRFRRMIK